MESPKLAALMIFNQGDQILLMRRCNTTYANGLYTLPSGKVEGNETFSIAAIREALEEVGLRADSRKLVAAHLLHRKEDNEVWIDAFFLCKDWKGTATNKEPHKCDDVRWFPLDKLPENMIPFVREVILKVFHKDEHYSEYGWDNNG